MPRVFTVDDSSTIRTIITKQLTEMGFEVEQAEDGVAAFAKLEEIEVDLILLDVTMPNMDGPTFLAQFREAGHKTPVIMLTSESKRQIISGAVKLGIEDYILKPFKADELKAKVLKALRMDAPGAPARAEVAAVSPAAPASGGAGDANRQFIDILVIDDMENVHKKLRTLLPAYVTMNACVSAREALQFCHERIYRVVLIDTVMPDVNSVALMNQVRALQPHTVVVALALRSAADAVGDAKGNGFHDALVKPFETEALDEFLSKYFESNDVLAVDGNVLACSSFEGKDDRIDRYFTRLKKLCKEAIEKLRLRRASRPRSSTCGAIPMRNRDKVVRFVIEVEQGSEEALRDRAGVAWSARPRSGR